MMFDPSGLDDPGAFVRDGDPDDVPEHPDDVDLDAAIVRYPAGNTRDVHHGHPRRPECDALQQAAALHIRAFHAYTRAGRQPHSPEYQRWQDAADAFHTAQRRHWAAI